MRPYFALVLLSVTLVSSATGKHRPKSMSIWLMQTEGCGASFDVVQEPSPFLTNVTEIKKKGVVKLRRDNETLENFPAEITLRIQYRGPEGGFFRTAISTKTSKVCNPVDPRKVQFKAIWSNKSRNVNADGIVLTQQELGPVPMCELMCPDRWTYELRIDSKGIPLTDNLLLVIDSPEGKHLAKLVGGLGPLEHVVNPITP